jgi:hypothetical protein
MVGGMAGEEPVVSVNEFSATEGEQPQIVAAFASPGRFDEAMARWPSWRSGQKGATSRLRT